MRIEIVLSFQRFFNCFSSFFYKRSNDNSFEYFLENTFSKFDKIRNVNITVVVCLMYCLKFFYNVFLSIKFVEF